MKFTLSDQLICFACSLLCGLALGVLYEVFRLIRAVLHGGKVFVFCCDVLFMFICALATVLFSICYARGTTRSFIIAGELVGILSVRFTLGQISIRFFEPLCRKILRKCRKIAVNMVKFAKKLLQVTTDVLYNNIRKEEPDSQNRRTRKIKGRGKRYYGVKTAE